MTLPAEDPRPDDSPDSNRPDWLLGMDEELAPPSSKPDEQAPRLVKRAPSGPRPLAAPTAPPVLRVPGAGSKAPPPAKSAPSGSTIPDLVGPQYPGGPARTAGGERAAAAGSRP